MQRTNRDMEKSLNRLTALKTERKALCQQDLEEAAALYQLNEIKHLRTTEAEIKTKNGFVFSTTEIRAFLERKRRLNELSRIENRQNNPHHGKNFQPKHPLSRAA
jgi:hypothetical protein